MKTTVLASIFAMTAVMLSACSSVSGPDLISVNAMKINGKDIYLRGEMNDYAAISSNRLIKRDEGMYCTLAALRSDWTPYRFKFADDNWSQADVRFYDIDGDGFSNIYEYVMKTDMGDPRNHPPLWHRLRVIEVGKVSLPVKFTGIDTTD